MAEVIVVLKSPDLAEEFLADARAAGMNPLPFPGLPRHFRLPGVSPVGFPFAHHPAVEAWDDGEEELTPAATQNVSLTADMMGTGGWAAARVIRRRDPWAPARAFPRTATFDAKRTGAGVDIFIIDSGVEYTHAEFGGRVNQYWHSQTSYAVAELDGSGHGSHCLGLALGRTVGIAREARGHSLKFFNANSGAGVSNAIAAMGAILSQYNAQADDDRPAVMFMSWSGFNSTIDAAVTDMINAGIVCCYPAGNEATDITASVIRPAESDPDTIVCGGLQMNDTAYYTPSTSTGEFGTNFSPTDVDILAPAQVTMSVRRTSEGGGYRTGSGTSYATPIVAGVVACMLQGYKRLTTRAQVQAVKQRLLDNATTGALKPLRKKDGTLFDLPDRIVYLDPMIEFEVIPGLVPRNP